MVLIPSVGFQRFGESKTRSTNVAFEACGDLLLNGVFPSVIQLTMLH